MLRRPLRLPFTTSGAYPRNPETNGPVGRFADAGRRPGFFPVEQLVDASKVGPSYKEVTMGATMKSLFQWWGQPSTSAEDSKEPAMTHPAFQQGGTETSLHRDSEDQLCGKVREDINLASPWTHGLL